MKRRVLGMFFFAVLGAALVHAQAVEVFTVFGDATTKGDMPLPAPSGWSVEAQNVVTNITVQTPLSFGEPGKYSLVFVDTDRNRAAALGDAIRVSLIDATGGIADSVTVEVDSMALEDYGIRVDVMGLEDPTPTDPKTWSAVKALFRAR